MHNKSENTDILNIEGLNKTFGKIHAVSNLSFKVKKGELFAFLGVNGAGKSTTISIICGQLQKDSGKIFIDKIDTDKDIESVKSKIGVVFQSSVLDKSLSVYDNLSCRAKLYGINGSELSNRLDEIDSLFDIKSLYKRSVGKLSGGQRRRIDIARALVHKPEILILDEPTTGLDPQTRKTIWQAVEKMRKDSGMTVLLTTHYMEEAADADYVVIIDEGKISAEGTPLQLKNTYTNDYITFYTTDEELVKSFGLPYERIRDAYRLSVENTEAAAKLIAQNSEVFKDFEITKGKMDDVFLAVTGKKAERAE